MAAKAPTFATDSETLVFFAVAAHPSYVYSTLNTFLGVFELPS